MQMLVLWCLDISRLPIADKERSVSFVIITSTHTPSSSNLMQLLLNTIHLKIDESTWLPDYVVRALGMSRVWAMTNRCDEHIPLPFRRWVCRLYIYMTLPRTINNDIHRLKASFFDKHPSGDILANAWYTQPLRHPSAYVAKISSHSDAADTTAVIVDIFSAVSIYIPIEKCDRTLLPSTTRY